jgi:hypothetical protein
MKTEKKISNKAGLRNSLIGDSKWQFNVFINPNLSSSRRVCLRHEFYVKPFETFKGVGRSSADSH